MFPLDSYTYIIYFKIVTVPVHIQYQASVPFTYPNIFPPYHMNIYLNIHANCAVPKPNLTKNKPLQEKTLALTNNKDNNNTDESFPSP